MSFKTIITCERPGCAAQFEFLHEVCNVTTEDAWKAAASAGWTGTERDFCPEHSGSYVTVQVRMRLTPEEGGEYEDYPPEQAAYKVVREALYLGTNADYNINSIQVQAPKGDWNDATARKCL